MIHYALRCAAGHGFDAWFASSTGFDTQQRDRKIECPVCATSDIVKAPMTPRIATSRGAKSEPSRDIPPAVPAAPNPAPAAAARVVAEFCRMVEAQCDYVGGSFPEEARKIHYGETDARPIYGEATRQEADSLKEEGIEVAAIPWVRKPDA